MLQRLKKRQAATRTAGCSWRVEDEVKCPIDELVLRQDVSTTKLTKMLLGADPFLDGTVVLLEDVVQILNRPMTTALS
jgi:hypothetical protein